MSLTVMIKSEKTYSLPSIVSVGALVQFSPNLN
jgi:hypothetical protein